jgi:hypothetical protein
VELSVKAHYTFGLFYEKFMPELWYYLHSLPCGCNVELFIGMVIIFVHDFCFKESFFGCVKC